MNENISSQSKIVDIQTVHKGKWLHTSLIKYTDPQGNEREWEAAGYIRNKHDETIPDGVQVVAVLKRSSHCDCFVLVQQFRPPVGCICIEFPAGLVDEQDSNVRQTALRELLEETGFTGTISDGEHLEVPTPLNSGFETSTTATVYVTIDGDDPKNLNCTQQLDDGEFIKVLFVPVHELLHRLNQFINDKTEKYLIDSRLYSFAMGLHVGTSLHA